MNKYAFCSPKANTTLVLSYKWLPIDVITARAALNKILPRRADSRQSYSIGKYGEMYAWDQWICGEDIEYNTNQPYLRSANRIYPIPTIILTTSKFTYQPRERFSRRYLYDRLGGRCQICGSKEKIHDMSIEHILPRSKHGTDDAFNITMTCRECNSCKSSDYPVKGFDDKELVAPPVIPYYHICTEARPEWQHYLFKG